MSALPQRVSVGVTFYSDRRGEREDEDGNWDKEGAYMKTLGKWSRVNDYCGLCLHAATECWANAQSCKEA